MSYFRIFTKFTKEGSKSLQVQVVFVTQIVNDDAKLDNETRSGAFSLSVCIDITKL